MPALVLVDAEAGALAVGRKPGTIHYWATRGWITRYGTRTARTYDLTELHDTAAAIEAGRVPNRKTTP